MLCDALSNFEKSGIWKKVSKAKIFNHVRELRNRARIVMYHWQREFHEREKKLLGNGMDMEKVEKDKRRKRMEALANSWETIHQKLGDNTLKQCFQYSISATFCTRTEHK